MQDQPPPDPAADSTAPTVKPRPIKSAMAPGRLTIDLGAIAANYQTLTDKVQATCAIAGIVKANAYGLGMKQVVPVLEHAACPLYFVATPQEGATLRTLTARPVAVMNGLMGPAEEYLQHDLLPVLNSLREIDIWRNLAEKLQRPLRTIIHFDTGMERLGLDYFETETLLKEKERLAGLDLWLIMTHMACADNRRSPMTARQGDYFDEVAEHFPDALCSLANSSAIFRGSRYHRDFARPGMALYGLNPTPEMKNPMKPVVTLDARVLQIRKVRAGETVGYGAEHTMEYDGTLATVALGYADGLPRNAYKKNLNLYWKGYPCPVRGRISMDLVTVDITAVKPPPLPGEMLEVIGPHQSVDDIAAIADTIGYEILTRLGPRYQRVYKGIEG